MQTLSTRRGYVKSNLGCAHLGAAIHAIEWASPTSAMKVTSSKSLIGSAEIPKWVIVFGNRKSEAFDQVLEPQFSPNGNKLAFGALQGDEIWWKVVDVMEQRNARPGPGVVIEDPRLSFPYSVDDQRSSDPAESLHACHVATVR